MKLLQKFDTTFFEIQCTLRYCDIGYILLHTVTETYVYMQQLVNIETL